MNITSQELQNVIDLNWGIEIEIKILDTLLSTMTSDEQIASVVDSTEAVENFNVTMGYAFCLSNRVIIIGEKQIFSIPISSITSINFSEGVAYTLSTSDLQLDYNSNSITLSSSRHGLMKNFYNTIDQKRGYDINVSTSVSQKDSGTEFGKLIFKIIVIIVVLYILSWIGASFE